MKGEKIWIPDILLSEIKHLGLVDGLFLQFQSGFELCLKN